MRVAEVEVLCESMDLRATRFERGESKYACCVYTICDDVMGIAVIKKGPGTMLGIVLWVLLQGLLSVYKIRSTS